MQLNLSKALFLSYLLTVSLSCEAAPGVALNATATPLPCNSGVGAAKCLIAYQQPELEAMADPGMLGASLKSITFPTSDAKNPAGCGRGPVVPNDPYCSPKKNKQSRCDQFYRVPGCA
ncbi:hypothetical protein ACJRO7_035557 [Eucalyptus globulus]|uniref:Uncharacterized protein n=1 Tax=Eucalyptus globulus TaxID=34317 RepID=A0ABD3JHS0_EUCGL